ECRRHHEKDVGFDLPQGIVIELELLHHPKRQVDDDDVGAADKATNDRFSRRVREIERDAALVAIEVQEETALAACGDGAEPAIFAALAPLDANHISAEICQQHGAIGRGDEAAKIDHANSLKQSSHNDPLMCTAQHPTCWT